MLLSPALPVHRINATLLSLTFTIFHSLAPANFSCLIAPGNPSTSPPPQQVVYQGYPLSPEVCVFFHILIFSCSANSSQMIISPGVGFKHGKWKFFHRKHCDASICYSDSEFSELAFHDFLPDGEGFVTLRAWKPSTEPLASLSVLGLINMPISVWKWEQITLVSIYFEKKVSWAQLNPWPRENLASSCHRLSVGFLINC